MLTRKLLRLWQDDLGRLREAYRRGDGQNPGSPALHLSGTAPPVSRAADTSTLTLRVWLRRPSGAEVAVVGVPDGDRLDKPAACLMARQGGIWRYRTGVSDRVP